MNNNMLIKLFVNFLNFYFLSVILSTGEAVPIGITLMAVIWLVVNYLVEIIIQQYLL